MHAIRVFVQPQMIDKIKEFIDEVVDVANWMLAGCPRPQPIPVRIKDVPSREKQSED